MNADHIAPFLYGALCGAWAALAVMNWALKRRLKAKAMTPAEFATDKRYTELLAKLKPATDSPWWADPSGTRIELADTGFYITFHPNEPRRVYQGHTPEHLPIAAGPLLDDMKKYMEDRAKERAQFAPQGGWKP